MILLWQKLPTKNIKKIQKQRTNEQNAYLWGCVYPMVKEGMLYAGWEDILDEEDAHEFCKSKFGNRKIVNRDTGEVENIPHSTSKMDTVEFSTYINSIRDWSSEYLNINIPDPNKWWMYNK